MTTTSVRISSLSKATHCLDIGLVGESCYPARQLHASHRRCGEWISEGKATVEFYSTTIHPEDRKTAIPSTIKMAHFYQAKLERPSHFNFTNDVVDYWAKQQPGLAAMEWVSQDLREHRVLTYSHFSKQSHRAAVLHESLGLRKGDRMVLILPRIPEW